MTFAMQGPNSAAGMFQDLDHVQLLSGFVLNLIGLLHFLKAVSLITLLDRKQTYHLSFRQVFYLLVCCYEAHYD